MKKEFNKKNIQKAVKDVLRSTSDTTKKFAKYNSYMTMARILILAKKVSKGIMTESRALAIINSNAAFSVIMAGVSVSSSVILDLMIKAQKKKDKENDEFFDKEDDIEDLDNLDESQLDNDPELDVDPEPAV